MSYKYVIKTFGHAESSKAFYPTQKAAYEALIRHITNTLQSDIYSLWRVTICPWRVRQEANSQEIIGFIQEVKERTKK